MYKRMRRVLILMHTWAGYLEDIQLGIAQYKAQRPEWICTRLLPMPQQTRDLSAMGFDGAIAYVEREYITQLRGMHKPIVDVSNWLPEQHFPRVLVDDLTIGRIAARHLMDLGLHNFAIVGLGDSPFSRLRRDGFLQELAKEGFTAEEMLPSHRFRLPEATKVPPGVSTELAAWLLGLPKPVGYFGTFDTIAAEAIEACRLLDISVPDEVCVLGVDNNELTAQFTHPPLSSIALPAQKIGFEAARLLDELMNGRKQPRKPILLPPAGVVSRQSTNLLAIPDDDVRLAVRYIREHVHDGVTVKDVLRVVPTNRRYLERKFKQHLGRSPLQEIRQVRISRAKELLSGGDLSMPVVARRSGFPNGERLANVFRQEVGVTPTEYRRQFRLRD